MEKIQILMCLFYYITGIKQSSELWTVKEVCSYDISVMRIQFSVSCHQRISSAIK